MKPVLFVIPLGGHHGIPVRAYGFMVMLGCLVAILVALRRAKREGADRNAIWDLWMWSLIGGFIGARAFYVWDFWPHFRGNLLSVFYIWEGGLAFQGGLLLAVLCGYVYLRMRRLPVAKHLDMVVAAVILGYAFARVGCLLNGCCHGRPTDVPWAITYPAAAPVDAAGTLRASPAWTAQVAGTPYRISDRVAARPECVGRVKDGRLVDTLGEYEFQTAVGRPVPMPRTCPLHPTQLYSAGYALVIFVALLVYARVPHHDGQVVSLFGVLYAAGRFTVEFFRGDSEAVLAGLTLFQLVCVGMFLAFGAAWFWCGRRMPAYVPPHLKAPPAQP